MEKNKKSFGGCFFKCLGIMMLIAFLSFLLPNLLKVFLAIGENSSNNLALLSTIQMFIPIILIIASVPVSLIYAAIKSGK